jgi:DNA-binding response OmpR family regulator
MADSRVFLLSITPMINANWNNAEPMMVLLVEDNPVDARLVLEYLDDAAPGRFQLVWVVQVSDALTELSVKRFDAVLLDLSLPDAAGVQGFTRLAKAAPGVPVIVLTGNEDTKIEKQLIALGARDYLRKGHFNGKLLAAVLVNWISLAKAHA